MNYITVTGLLLAGLVLVRVIANYLSCRWKNEAHELFADIDSTLADPVAADDLRRARNYCERGKKATSVSRDSDFEFLIELGMAVGIIVLFCILGRCRDNDLAKLREELTAGAQQTQVQAVEEQPCAEQK